MLTLAHVMCIITELGIGVILSSDKRRDTMLGMESEHFLPPKHNQFETKGLATLCSQVELVTPYIAKHDSFAITSNQTSVNGYECCSSTHK